MSATETSRAAGPDLAADGSERWGTILRRLLILIALYAAPIDVVFRPVAINPDIWWHLRTGQWVIDHRAIPQTDPFSAYGQGKRWVAYSWLYEVGVYGLYHAFGLCGVIAYRVVLAAAILISLHRFIARREPHFVRATFLTAVGFYAIYPVLIQERPWLFTVLFTLWTLSAVLRLRDGTATRAVWLLPAIFTVWANVHIQFIYGLALLGLGCAAPLLDARLGRPLSRSEADTPRTRPWWRLVTLTAACAAATLLNPYGLRVYGVVLEYATQPGPYALLPELSAPAFRSPTDWTFLALGTYAVYVLGRRGRPSVYDLLILAGTTYLSFRAGRDTWLLTFAALAVLTARPRPALSPADRFTLSPARVAAVAAAVALFMILYVRHYAISERGYEAEVARMYPVAAVRHVKDAGYPGPLFTVNMWGGYAMFFLPGYPVNFDGRTNLHGDERLTRHVLTTYGFDWRQDPDLTRARLLILPNTRPLHNVLDREPHFRKVYADDVTTVFVTADGVP